MFELSHRKIIEADSRFSKQREDYEKRLMECEELLTSDKIKCDLIIKNKEESIKEDNKKLKSSMAFLER